MKGASALADNESEAEQPETGTTPQESRTQYREEEIRMRKIVAGLWLALDGVMESPEKWSFAYGNDEVGQAIGAQFVASDAMLLGRRTYQEFAAVWPQRTSAEFGPLADAMNNTPKYVVSTTLDSVEWQNSTLIKGNLAEELARLKQQPGKNITISGSATLVRSLLRDGLLDELQLFVCPILVGTGKHLFENDGEQVPLKLVESRAFSTGVLSLVYAPVGR
jgi:dihydrofolate reductase